MKSRNSSVSSSCRMQMMKPAETNESLTKEMMMDRSVREGLLRLMPLDETLREYFIFTFSLLVGVCVYLVKEVKSLGATYGIPQLLRMLVTAHVLRFMQSGIYKVPPEYYLQNVLKFYDLPITATISAFYTIFLIFPSPPNILVPALFLMFGIIISAPTRMELGQDDISPTQGSSSDDELVNQQNPINIQVTDHFSSIILAMICVDLAVELEKLKETYYVFSMVFVLASRHMPYIWQTDLPENNIPLAFYLRKVFLYYELPCTAAINGIYMIFITFSKTLLIIFCMELTLLAVLMYKREEPEHSTNPTQASSLNTNSLLVPQQSLDAANIGDANLISDTNNFNTMVVHQPYFSKWRRGKHIGSGQYGHVYVYENSENPAEKRAVKELIIRADGENKSTLREVEIISKLKPHPNIVQYYGHNMDEQGHISLHMEYFEQGSLYNYMKVRGRLAEHAVQYFTSQILSGLSYLHCHKIVHRDIKPKNILIDTKDSKDIIKLVDFGLSKKLADSMDQHTFGGTQCFVAPEILRREQYKRSTDAFAADIWSLGCVVIEMFTGDLPDKWPFQNLENPPIPEGLSKTGNDFLKRCFQRDPRDRPSAAMLLDDPFVARTSTNKDEQGPICLHMEYIKQGSLHDYVLKHGKLDEPLIRDFTAQILSGLLHLHRNKIVHRDIKPENLLVDYDNTVKLVDFGLAKVIGESKGKHSVWGTPYYAAPELFHNKMYECSSEAYKADIWSLGCVIIFMFTRDHPRTDYDQPHPQIPERLSKEGKDFLKLCFKRNPADRPSAEKLLEDPFITAQNGALIKKEKQY